ncbi:hypothetical protein NKH77_06110 [Streptomyces sp. M19]
MLPPSSRTPRATPSAARCRHPGVHRRRVGPGAAGRRDRRDRGRGPARDARLLAGAGADRAHLPPLARREPPAAHRRLRTRRRGRLPLLRGPPRRHVQAQGRADEHDGDRGGRHGHPRCPHRRRPAPGDGRDLAVFVTGDVASHTVLRELSLRLEPAKVPGVCRILDEIPSPCTASTSASSSPSYSKGARRDRPYRTGQALRHAVLRLRPGPCRSGQAGPVRGPARGGRTLLRGQGQPAPGDPARDARRAGRGCRAEISSTGELAAVLQAGFAGADILYTGPGKTGEELDEALTAGVRLFSVESLGDLRNLGSAAQAQGVVADCLLRVNNATGAASTSIRMTGVPSQFGFDSETLPALRENSSTSPAPASRACTSSR